MTPAIALILARAGSKGVPGKNIVPIAGKPCIAWTIDYALRSCSPSLREGAGGGFASSPATRHLTHLAISTDDPKISDLVRTRYPQLDLIPRPPALATDTARVDDAARHALESLESKYPNLKDPRIIILYANVPVRPAGLIERALKSLDIPNTDSVQSYQPVGKNHPWWMARLDSTGQVSPWEGDVLNHNVYRRQDLPPAYLPDGAILAVTRRALMLQIPDVPPGPHAFFGLSRRGLETAPGEVIDIDSPLDLAVAEATLRKASTVTP